MSDGWLSFNYITFGYNDCFLDFYTCKSLAILRKPPEEGRIDSRNSRRFILKYIPGKYEHEIIFSVMLAFDKSDAMKLIMQNSYFEPIIHLNAI